MSELVRTRTGSTEGLPVASRLADKEPLGGGAETPTESAAGPTVESQFLVKGPRTDFGLIPIPKRCRYDPEHPFEFSMFLNGIFAVTATFTVANLYYSQPILVDMAAYFGVSYEEVTRVPSLIQAGYCVSLVFVGPLGDIVPRRPMLLTLVFGGAVFSIGLAVAKNFAAFQALSFIVGVFTVVPQVLNPLAADLAPPRIRSQAVSIVICGLISGMMFARVFAGIITKFSSSFKNVYWMAVGIQFLILALLWWTLPAYPRKQKGVSYFQILFSMAKFMVTKPLLIQACLLGFLSCGIFVTWWTTLTFLLTDTPYEYDAFVIGLFGLCGTVSIILAPFLGRFTDRVHPWTGSLCFLILQLGVTVISVTSARFSLAAVIIICILTDIAQQGQQIGNQTRVYTIDPLSRGRLNGCYGAFVFLGQALGSSAGSRVYLQYGWRACYGMSVAFSCTCICILLIRGPHATGWIGWSGIYSISKAKPLPTRDVGSMEKDIGEKTVVDEGEREGEDRKEGKVNTDTA